MKVINILALQYYHLGKGRPPVHLHQGRSGFAFIGPVWTLCLLRNCANITTWMSKKMSLRMCKKQGQSHYGVALPKPMRSVGLGSHLIMNVDTEPVISRLLSDQYQMCMNVK